MFFKNRSNQPELLDLSGHSPLELANNYRDMAFINRYLGVHGMVLAHFRQLLKKRGNPGQVTILDLATGAGDVPLALIRWGRKSGIEIKALGLEINRQAIAMVRERAVEYPEMSFLLGNIMDLPYGPSSVDYTLCNTTLHHFTFDQSIRIIQNMAEISRYGFIITDLRRGLWPYLLAKGACFLISQNRLTRFDGPRSVQKSYTYKEFWHLAQVSGLKGIRVYKHPFLRLAMIWEK